MLWGMNTFTKQPQPPDVTAMLEAITDHDWFLLAEELLGSAEAVLLRQEALDNDLDVTKHLRYAIALVDPKASNEEVSFPYKRDCIVIYEGGCYDGNFHEDNWFAIHDKTFYMGYSSGAYGVRTWYDVKNRLLNYDNTSVFLFIHNYEVPYEGIKGQYVATLKAISNSFGPLCESTLQLEINYECAYCKDISYLSDMHPTGRTRNEGGIVHTYNEYICNDCYYTNLCAKCGEVQNPGELDEEDLCEYCHPFSSQLAHFWFNRDYAVIKKFLREQSEFYPIPEEHIEKTLPMFSNHPEFYQNLSGGFPLFVLYEDPILLDTDSLDNPEASSSVSIDSVLAVTRSGMVVYTILESPDLQYMELDMFFGYIENEQDDILKQLRELYFSPNASGVEGLEKIKEDLRQAVSLNDYFGVGSVL
jgi:hypothetical protein